MMIELCITIIMLRANGGSSICIRVRRNPSRMAVEIRRARRVNEERPRTKLDEQGCVTIDFEGVAAASQDKRVLYPEREYADYEPFL